MENSVMKDLGKFVLGIVINHPVWGVMVVFGIVVLICIVRPIVKSQLRIRESKKLVEHTGKEINYIIRYQRVINDAERNWIIEWIKKICGF